MFMYITLPKHKYNIYNVIPTCGWCWLFGFPTCEYSFWFFVLHIHLIQWITAASLANRSLHKCKTTFNHHTRTCIQEECESLGLQTIVNFHMYSCEHCKLDADPETWQLQKNSAIMVQCRNFTLHVLVYNIDTKPYTLLN